MKPRITIFIPSSEKLQSWIEGLLELKLIADIRVEQLNWTEQNHGSFADWSNLALKIHHQWDQSDGIVIWSPGKSAQSTAGYLSLVYPHPGIPLINFCAPLTHISGTLELGLKSLLINSVFLAASDLAEVLVLSGTKVMRPQNAVIRIEEGQQQIRDSLHPITELNSSLQQITVPQKRSDLKPELIQPNSLEANIAFGQFFSSSQEITYPNDVRAVVLEIDPSLRQAKAIKKAEKSTEKEGIPLLLYTAEHWADGQLFSAQQWWMSLITQYAFGLYSDNEQALEFIRERI